MRNVLAGAVRTVRDEQHCVWHVYVVVEHMATATRRQNWLCLESKADRRFIAPIPDDWERWDDRELLRQIRHAIPDLRDREG